MQTNFLNIKIDLSFVSALYHILKTFLKFFLIKIMLISSPPFFNNPIHPLQSWRKPLEYVSTWYNRVMRVLVDPLHVLHGLQAAINIFFRDRLAFFKKTFLAKFSILPMKLANFPLTMVISNC